MFLAGDLFLAGDIGGTKTTLGLFNTLGQLLHSAYYENAHAGCIDAIVQRFIDEHKQCQPGKNSDSVLALQGICLGIAGPVHNQICQMTNLPWRVDAKHLTANWSSDKSDCVPAPQYP